MTATTGTRKGLPSTRWPPRTLPAEATNWAAGVKIPRLITIETDRAVRRVLVGCYALGVAAGVLGMIFQPPQMVNQTGVYAARVWGLYTLLGAAGCLAGVLMPRGARGDWFGEYVSLPALASAVALYGAAITLTAIQDAPGRAPAGVLLLATTGLLWLRWRTVNRQAHDQCRPPTLTDAE